MAKIKILFACAWGISSSLLAEKVKQAGNKQGLDIDVECTAAENALSYKLEQYNAVLIGPQVRYYKQKFEEKAKNAGLRIPVASVDGLLYAMADGEAVLKQVLQVLAQAKGDETGNPGKEAGMK